MKRICIVCGFLLVAGVTSASIVTFTYEQVGSDVVLTAAGGYDNINGLTFSGPGGVGTSSGFYSGSPYTSVYSGGDSSAVIFVSSGYALTRIDDSILKSGSDAGWNWADTSGVSGEGPFYFQLYDSGNIGLALPYNSSTETAYSSATFSGSSTWNNQTLEGLDLAPGTYEIRWDSGNQGVDITVVPEPASAMLLFAGFGLLGLVRRFYGKS
jgi:hypothetical protein